MTLDLSKEEARELVEHFGTYRRASMATGVSEHALRYRLNQTYQDRARAFSKAQYEQISAYEYNRILLQNRRYKAMRRMGQREQRRRDGSLQE